VLETPEGPVRTNRIVRRVEAVASGTVVEERTIAENRRRMLNPEARQRTCLTCGETECHARVEVPEKRAAAS
jgi:vancomycin resistance protein VanW